MNVAVPYHVVGARIASEKALAREGARRYGTPFGLAGKQVNWKRTVTVRALAGEKVQESFLTRRTGSGAALQ